MDGGRVCARDCSREACPTGYVCSPVTREDDRVAGQCLPERGMCGGCADADTDGICDETDVCAGDDDTLDANSMAVEFDANSDIVFRAELCTAMVRLPVFRHAESGVPNLPRTDDARSFTGNS
ncbi:MAG: hypothetical protein KGO50_04115 [Myxococcales bacterium]|nr:hypothetical protein [Myxococcales bacterium]